MESVPSLEEEKKEKVKEIEQLPLGTNQRAELILVLLGLKPATNVQLYPWDGSPLAIKNTLGQLGFHAKVMEREKFSKNMVQEYAVSLDEKTAEKLALLNPAKDHEEFGKLMGFPKTAIHAYLNKEELLERESRPEDNNIIFSFGLSKNHWKKEIELLRTWSNAIKEYAPDLFKELRRKE